MINSSVMQCQVMNAAMRVAEMSPEETVRERDLSNVKTRWRTVAVAMCIESSSPAFLSATILSNHKLPAHLKDIIFLLSSAIRDCKNSLITA